jgi:hypothetical protein
VRGFLFSLSTLSGCGSKGRRQERKCKWQGKESLWSPSQVYKGPGRICPKLCPSPSRNLNLKSKWFFRSSNDSRTRNGYPVSRSSYRINSLAGHTSPLASERASFRLRHHDRLKKCVPHCFSLYPFLLSPLSLSLSVGIGKGAKETGPEPSY